MTTSRSESSTFDPTCRDCPRLAEFLDDVREVYPAYHCRPVPPFGDPDAQLVIVGLAPGKHGANATGRPFTGDYAGILLYQTLYKYGFSNKAQSESPDDDLTLSNCRITNAVKCLPPENKPANDEIIRCNRYLRAELAVDTNPTVLLALGGIAHKAVLRSFDLPQARFPFAHLRTHSITPNHTLLDSYHCSRYNTQTKRLTTPMFEQVFELASELLR